MTVPAIPNGFTSITPYLIVADPVAEIDFFQKALGGEITEQLGPPGGVPQHTQIKLRDCMLMIGPADSPEQAMSTMLYIYVDDCDAAHAQAIAEGAEEIMAIADQAYGDRHGMVKSPGGNLLCIATQKEVLSGEELAARMAAQHA